MDGLAAAAFLVIMGTGAVLLVDGLRRHPTFWPEPVIHHPRRIFRIVQREDRAAYSRMMRRTVAIQTRDVGRALNRMTREIGKAFEGLAEQLRRMFP